MTYKYIGKTFIPGVPARDLTDDEAKRYGVDLIENSGLWVKDEPKKKPNKDKKDGE